MKREERAQLPRLGEHLGRGARVYSSIEQPISLDTCWRKSASTGLGDVLAGSTDASIETAHMICIRQSPIAVEAAATAGRGDRRSPGAALGLRDAVPRSRHRAEGQSRESVRDGLRAETVGDHSNRRSPQAMLGTILPCRMDLVLTPFHQEFAITRSAANLTLTRGFRLS